MSYELVSYHTTQGKRMAVITKTGRKFIHLLLMGDNHIRTVPLSEGRYFKSLGEPSKPQIRTFNRVARTMGYNKQKPPL
jgi:hypothetical protein